MTSFEYTITDPQGIHARPAGQLVAEVKKFACNISIEKDGKANSCKKLLAIMSMAIKAGDTVKMTFDGENEAEACAAIKKFMEETL